MIKAIEIGDGLGNYLNKYGSSLFNLNNLNKINIFVGENNSGKSRLLRMIIKNSNTKMFENKENGSSDELNFKEAKQNLLRYIKNFNSNSDEQTKIVLPKELNNLDDVDFYCEASDYINSLKINENDLNGTCKSYFQSIKNCSSNMCQYLTVKNNTYGSLSVNSQNIVYIPVLRGIENFNIYFQPKNNEYLNSIPLTYQQRQSLEEYKSNANHIYLNKISNTYGINKKHIYTAENIYEDVKNKLLGKEEERNFIRDFEEFISKEFFDGEGFNIIPQIKEGCLNVKIRNGKERKLYDLGDGIKQLITIFYKMFELKNTNAIFFIEEPEINLHPGYQRQLIEILQNNVNFKQHQIFLTTHSNHIIDSCLNYDNISIYKFINMNNNNNKFKVLNTTPKDLDVLELLGVKNSSVFLSNCTIWVEGISDKILISKYLKVYLEHKNNIKLKEDIHYSFIEYGGNNITHWAFIDNDDIETINASGITNKSFIICDNDNGSKQNRKEKLKSIFKENFYELTVREIENTISKKVLEKTLFGEKEIKYSKNYKGKTYANKISKMGNYIDENYQLTKKYKDKKTGTILNKLDFSKKIASNINSYEDLSIQAKNLCDKIYNFIIKSNNYKI